MRLNDSDTDRFIVRSAINDYEAGRISDARGKFLQVASRPGNIEPCVFEYLYLIFKYEDPVDPVAADVWRKRFVDVAMRRADGGDVGWQLKIAEMHLFGDRVPLDTAYARKAYSELAHKGVAEAQYRLAVMYKHGQCELPVDHDQYVVWLAAAADNGFPEAEFEMASLLLSGCPVDTHDRAKAMAYLRRAASDGFKLAQDALNEFDDGGA